MPFVATTDAIRTLSICLKVSLLCSYFSLQASGRTEDTTALLQFHFRVEQTSHSIVEEHEVKSVFTTVTMEHGTSYYVTESVLQTM